MKAFLISSLLGLAGIVALQAGEVTATITNVHLCCKGCVQGVEQAVSAVPRAKATADQEAGTVTLRGPDKPTLRHAADALVQAGYYGQSSDPGIKLNVNSGAKGQQVQTLEIEGVHLCCAKCVKAVDQAVKSVPGVENQTAVKRAKSFQVKGNFNDREVFEALQKEGLAGRIAQSASAASSKQVPRNSSSSTEKE
jgi:copper chaperone CopZ